VVRGKPISVNADSFAFRPGITNTGIVSAEELLRNAAQNYPAAISIAIFPLIL
jgi:hypothetical protein